MSVRPIVGVLLSAGSASRFGGAKLLARGPEGAVLGLRSLAHLAAVADSVLAVVRPGDDALAACFAREGVRVTVCPDAGDGMGASLAWGVRAAPVAAGWLVALGDMPWIRTETIARIAAAVRAGAAIAVPSVHGRRGHPVGFAARFYDELTQLSGDTGAKAVCAAHAGETTVIETDDEGITRDVDLRADWPQD